MSEFKKLSVRSVNIKTLKQLEWLKRKTMLPWALLIEGGLELPWDLYEEEDAAPAPD